MGERTPGGRRSTWSGCACSRRPWFRSTTRCDPEGRANEACATRWPPSRTPTTARLRRRAAPVPEIVRDSVGGSSAPRPRAGPRAGRAAARRDRRLRGRRLNAIGIFHAFVPDARVQPRLRGRRRGPATGRSAASITGARPACCTASGLRAAGRGRADPRPASISAGLDSPGVGPEHAWLHDTGRADYRRSPTPRPWRPSGPVPTEGIIPAPGSSPRARRRHSSWAGEELGPDALILVDLSGRGGKDVATVHVHLFGV